MFKRLATLGAAALTALTSGCGDGPATVAGWRSPAAWSSMVYATSDGPMLIQVHGNPFNDDQPGFRRHLAAAMTNQIIGRTIAFTPDHAAAPRPQFRVVLAFNPPADLDARQLCGGPVAVSAQSGGRITIMGAFCDTSSLLASVKGWVNDVADADDPRFRRLMGQVTRDLFGSSS